MTRSRFDYVAYDKTASEMQEFYKKRVIAVEGRIEDGSFVIGEMRELGSHIGCVGVSRSFSLAVEKANFLIDSIKKGCSPEDRLTILEEFYMWAGKAIRDDQIRRDSGTKLQEGRTNS